MYRRGFVVIGILAIGFGVCIRILKTGPVCNSLTDLTGKTVLITGANAGIGKEAAIELAKHNAKVIIASRNVEKCRDAVKEIKRKSDNRLVDFMRLDLSDMADVRRFAKEFITKEKRLDILVNNAATIELGRTKDGFDLMFSVNVLGPFLLTDLLLPLMRNTSKQSGVRIINVSSNAYAFGKIDFDNLNIDYESRSVLDGYQNYANQKLMINYLTMELDKRMKLENAAISSYSLHPGIIATDIGVDFMNDHGIFWSIFRQYFPWIFGRSEFLGAQTILHCCLEEGLEKQSGSYFYDLQQTELWPHVIEPGFGAKLWIAIEEFVHSSA